MGVLHLAAGAVLLELAGASQIVVAAVAVVIQIVVVIKELTAPSRMVELHQILTISLQGLNELLVLEVMTTVQFPSEMSMTQLRMPELWIEDVTTPNSSAEVLLQLHTKTDSTDPGLGAGALDTLEREPNKTSRIVWHWAWGWELQREEQSKFIAQVEAKVDGTAAFNEFIAMALFVFIGCGSAMSCKPINDDASTIWILQVSLTFGFAITSLAAATDGQINCAVTLGKTIIGKLSILQGLVNFISQVAGSVVGAGALACVYNVDSDCTGTLGSNGVGTRNSIPQALLGEIVMTGLLMFVVLASAGSCATLACGFAVFIAHSVLIPIDGCSIDPTRSFGPELVSYATGRKGITTEHWVFWLGPLLGAVIGALVWKIVSA